MARPRPFLSSRTHESGAIGKRSGAMDIKDFQRIAKAAGMKPTDRDDMTEIASPDGEDAYVLRLGAVTDDSEVDVVWLSLQRGLRREDGREWLMPRTGRVLRCRVWDAEAGWLEPVAGGNAINRLRGLVDELHGWAARRSGPHGSTRGPSPVCWTGVWTASRAWPRFSRRAGGGTSACRRSWGRRAARPPADGRGTCRRACSPPASWRGG